jgi:hypothetical protein
MRPPRRAHACATPQPARAWGTPTSARTSRISGAALWMRSTASPTRPRSNRSRAAHESARARASGPTSPCCARGEAGGRGGGRSRVRDAGQVRGTRPSAKAARAADGRDGRPDSARRPPHLRLEILLHQVVQGSHADAGPLAGPSGVHSRWQCRPPPPPLCTRKLSTGHLGYSVFQTSDTVDSRCEERGWRCWGHGALRTRVLHSGLLRHTTLYNAPLQTTPRR